MPDFDLSLSYDFDEPEEEEAAAPQPESHIKVHRYGHRHLSRKAQSEQALFDALDWHFQEGECYHCFSFGDVDELTFFKHVLHQQKIKYLALSTWCMAGEDVDDLRKYWQRGMLGRVDFFLGEYFPKSYPEAYTMMKDLAEDCRGRCCVFKNHAKVMVIVGERFDCLIESSANVNTNPRSENTVVTIDRNLVRDYVDLFNSLKGGNRDYPQDMPGYTIPRRDLNG